MITSPVTPVSYSRLMPASLGPYLTGRVVVPQFIENDGYVFQLGTRNFCDFEPGEAFRSLRLLNDFVARDRTAIRSDETNLPHDERVIEIKAFASAGDGSKPVRIRYSLGNLADMGALQLGASELTFVDEVIEENGEGDSNKFWDLKEFEEQPIGIGARKDITKVVIENTDTGQRIRSEINMRRLMGRLTLTEGDVSVSLYCDKTSVGMLGLAFYSPLRGLADYVGMPYRLDSKTNLVNWMGAALEKMRSGLFPTNQALRDGSVVGDRLKFRPISWSDAKEPGRNRVIKSGKISVTSSDGIIKNVEHPAVKISLVASSTAEIDDSGAARRVRVHGQDLPLVFVEVFRPYTDLYSPGLRVEGDLKNWIERIWSGE